MTARSEKILATVAEQRLGHPHLRRQAREDLFKKKWRDAGAAASKSEIDRLRRELEDIKSRLDRSLPVDSAVGSEHLRPFDVFLERAPEARAALRGKVVAFHLRRGEVVASGASYDEVRSAVEANFPLADVVFDAVPEE